MSLSAIAKLIDVSKSTVSREIKKNSNMYRHYVAIEAQQFSEMRKKIPRRPRKLSKEDWQDIEQCLKRHWSPETIVGVRKREGKTCVSIEWLYHIIRRDKERGGTLYTYLPHHLKHRKKPVSSRIPIKDRVSIDERPAVVDSKSRFGDWEMDTIIGKDGKGAIVTLVERTTKKLLMAKSPKGKNAKAVAKLVVQLLKPYERHVRTITTDNGTEFAEHKYIAKMLHTKVFFAHPYSSWEKGLVENTNKLIRQYIPNGTDFSSLSDDYILFVQTELNLRPRKLLNFSSPKQKFFLSLHNSVALDC
jgi:IS30 family transposase